jgi:TolA-binding protein
MPKRLSLAAAATLAVLLFAGPAYPQKTEILQLQSDVITLQGLVKELQRSIDSRNLIMQTLLERTVDKVNLLGGEIQAGIQTSVQSGVQSNAQTAQANTERLMRAMEDMKAQNEKNNAALTASIAALGQNIEKLTVDLSDKLDRAGANNERLAKSTADLIGEKNDKLGAGLYEKLTQNFNGLQLQLTAIQDQLAKLAAPKAEPLPSPEKLFSEAYGYVLSGFYADALEGFNDILRKFPDHSIAVRAQLAKGEIQFRQGQWDDAAITFDNVFQNYRDPVSKRIALYQRGLTEEKLQQKDKAIATFTQVREQYPDTEEANGAMEALKRLAPPPPPPPTPARGAAAPQRG